MKVDKGARENLLSRAWGKFVKITDGHECRSYRRDCRKTLRVFQRDKKIMRRGDPWGRPLIAPLVTLS